MYSVIYMYDTCMGSTFFVSVYVVRLTDTQQERLHTYRYDNIPDAYYVYAYNYTLRVWQ